jgi:integrase
MGRTTAKPLTHAAVERFRYRKGGSKIQRLWDASVPGLGVEVFASQHKSWIFRYRIGVRQRIITLGAFADHDLDTARDLAVEARSRARVGEDPKIARDAPKKAQTISALWSQYQDTAHFKTRSESFRAGMASTMRTYVLPEWGHLGVAALRRWQIRDKVDNLIQAGKEGAARGLLNRLRILMNHALEREIIEDSPADHIKPSYTTTGRRDAWLQTDDELRAAWWIDAPLQVRALVRWLLLTGCRIGEARVTRQDWVTDAWRVPKTKNTQPLVLPVMPMMQQIVDEMKQTFGRSEWLFPSTVSTFKPIPRGSWDYVLRTATGGKWSAHVLRHSIESHLRELGVSEEARDAILNHVRKSGGYRYGHGEKLDTKRDALVLWHGYLRQRIDIQGTRNLS